MKKTVLIIDDVASLADLIRARILDEFDGRISVECLANEADLRRQLNACLAHETVLMVNAAFKPYPAATRCEFAGIRRTIKRGLRLTWLNQSPVIAYCTIPADPFLNLAVGSFFRRDPAHVYLNLAGFWDMNFRPVIEATAQIPGDQALKKFIYKYCRVELNDFINSVLHQLCKTYKLDSEVGRREFIDCLKHLERILDSATVDNGLLLNLKRAQSDLIEQENQVLAKRRIRSIREKLVELSDNLRKEEASLESPQGTLH
jgi:hypothetical protein